MGLKKNGTLQDPSAKSDVEFRYLLLPVELIKGKNCWKAHGSMSSSIRTTPNFTPHYSLDGLFYFTCYSRLTLHLQITIYFNPYKIMLMEFNSLKAYENHLDQLITQKNAKFLENGNMKLLQRWQKIVEQNSTYIVEKIYIQISIYCVWNSFKRKTLQTFIPVQ